MDREDRNCKQNDGWNAHQRNEGSDQEDDPRDNLSGDCDPSHTLPQRNTHCMKDAGEHFWSLGPFRQTVCQKSITSNQSKGDRRIGRKPRSQIPPSQYFRGESRHCSFPITIACTVPSAICSSNAAHLSPKP